MWNTGCAKIVTRHLILAMIGAMQANDSGLHIGRRKSRQNDDLSMQSAKPLTDKLLRCILISWLDKRAG